MLESVVQKKIIDHLTKEKWFVLKIISANKNGIPDLMAIKNGQTIFIEVKQKGKKVKKGGLQEYRIKELNSFGVLAFQADSLEVVVRNLEEFKKTL
jgi:Holliday junction resolvase